MESRKIDMGHTLFLRVWNTLESTIAQHVRKLLTGPLKFILL